MSFYANKEVLVTGGTGLIGRPLVEMLLAQDAKVSIVSLDDPSRAPSGAQFVKADLRELRNCLDVCEGKEIVFHLAGVKGSPKMTADMPASYFENIISFNTNIFMAARKCGVSRLLYTSTVGVYHPAEIFIEDDVENSLPSPNDFFAGVAKRTGEWHAQALKIQYGWDKISIVRPANVYGPYDNFDPDTGMVIPSLIRRAVDGENPLKVWGDGSPIRDFIHCKDVARGMMMAVEKGINVPVNLGSGSGVSIKNLVEVITKTLDNLMPETKHLIEWDISKPSGDAIRLMSMDRARKLMGFKAEINLTEGIEETTRWYMMHQDEIYKRYDPFKEK